MITDLRTKRYRSNKHFSEFLPRRRRQKSAGIDLEQNYVALTLCITPPPLPPLEYTGAVLGQNIGGPPLPFPFLFPSLPLEVGPLNTARGFGGALQAPPAGLERPRNRILSILALKSDIWWHQIYYFFVRIN